eukprot:3474875-Rhodomonas_salina.2
MSDTDEAYPATLLKSVSGTDVAYGATRARAAFSTASLSDMDKVASYACPMECPGIRICYEMSGTDTWKGTRMHYEMSGTEMGHAGTRPWSGWQRCSGRSSPEVGQPRRGEREASLEGSVYWPAR